MTVKLSIDELKFEAAEIDIELGRIYGKRHQYARIRQLYARLMVIKDFLKLRKERLQNDAA